MSTFRNRLTFSLASLIFLIALGLVFVPISVLAHAPLADGTKPGNLNHSHPTATIDATDFNGDGDTSDDYEGQIDGHSGHPELKSITVKQNAGQVKGNDVVITSTANTFTLVIEFTNDVSDAVGNTPSATPVPLESDEFNTITLNIKNRLLIAGNLLTIATPTRVPSTLNKFEALVTVDNTSDAIPTGVTTDLNEKVIVGFRIQADAVFTGPVDLGGALGNVNGIANVLSPAASYKEFTLVAAHDNTAPTVGITHTPDDDVKLGSDNEVTFTFTFTEELAAFAAANVAVTNGTKGTLSGPDATTKKVYTLPVTVTDPTMDVKVTVSGVTDKADNALGSTSETYEAAKPPKLAPKAGDPLVAVGGVTKRAGRKNELTSTVTFTLPFNEPMSTVGTNDFIVTSNVYDKKTEKTTTSTVSSLAVAQNSTTNALTLTVSGISAESQQEVLVVLRPTGVTDANGNPLLTEKLPAHPTEADVEALRAKGIPVTWTPTGYMPWTFKADAISPRVEAVTITPDKGGGGAAPSGANALGGGGGLTAAETNEEGPPVTSIEFEFDFDAPLHPDPPGNFVSNDIDLTGESNVDTVSPPTADPLDPTKYKVTVTPLDPNKPTIVLLRENLVTDPADNPLEELVRLTYTPKVDSAAPVVVIADPASALSCNPTITTLASTSGNQITITVTNLDEPGSPVIPATPVPAGQAIAQSEVTIHAMKNGVEVTGDATGWRIINFTSTSANPTTTPPTLPSATFNLVPIKDTDGSLSAAALGVTAVTVKVADKAVMDGAGNESAVKDEAFTIGPVLTIPAGGYILVIRPEHRALPPNGTHLGDPLLVGYLDVRPGQTDIQDWDCMPDLTVFFQRGNVPKDKPNRPGIGGGALVVKQAGGPLGHTGAAITNGLVGISEIMWASDEGIPYGGNPPSGFSNRHQTQEQWIELHNKSGVEVKVTLFARPANKALTVESDEIDRMSNYQYNIHWDVPGDSGDSAFGKDFIAMQRKNTSYGGDTGYRLKDGTVENWMASSYIYLTRRTQLTNVPPEDQVYNFLGTPGRSNAIDTFTPTVKTPIPLKPFVINEVANRTNAHYEWIEIRNTFGAEANLRNYEIGIVTGKKDSSGNFVEDSLFLFPNSDIKIPKDGLLLVLASDPEDDGEHPIAVGIDVLGGTDQVRGIGLDNADSKLEPASYIVAKNTEMFYTGGLPDDGEFILILRKPEAPDKPGTNKRGTADRIIDVAGYHPDLTVSGNVLYSGPYGLWPLVLRKPAFSKNQMNRDMVYNRRDIGRPGVYGENNNDKPSFVTTSYTGVGYRRHAQNIPAHGGTPGYHDIRKNLVGDVAATGTVTISEIMFDRGRGENLPQWIELYNSSATQAINLHSEAGWRLMIENYDDGEMPLGRVSGTLNFKTSEVQTILPQQTVLVASSRARSAGGATLNSSVVFIPTRVFSVFDDARGELGMKRSTDPILSTKAFNIMLVDGKGNVSDEIGNLKKSRGRVAAEAAWEWDVVRNSQPNQHPFPEDARVSVLRRYNEYKDGALVGRYSDDDIMKMGATAAGWLSAHVPYKRGFLNVPDTWYGDGNDIGTPAVTGGGPLPVSLSKFRPERLKATGEIVIRWVTESELNNAGFNILRSETRDGEFTKLNEQLILGQGTTSERTAYEWKDTTAKPNVVYYYQIQDVSLDGNVQTLRQSRLKGNVTPAGKLTTTWGELKTLRE